MVSIKKVVDFLINLKKEDVIINIFHNDADGVCSCVLMNRFLKRKICKEADSVIAQPMPPAKNLLQRIRLSLPSKIIFLDLSIDQDKSIIKKLEQDCEILIIDHHQISNNLNSKKTVHYNPLFENPSIYQSGSYLTYKICSTVLNDSDWDKKNLWLAIIGIIGDYYIRDSLDIIKKAEEYYSDIIKNNDQEALHNSLFGQVSDMISAAKACKISCEEIVNIINSMETVHEINKQQKLVDSYKKVQEDIERIKIDIKSNIDSNKNVLFYEKKSKYNLRSPIATIMSNDYPKKLIVVWEDIKNKIKISARNQNKNINVAKTLKSVIKDFKYASAGGHEAAAGASIRKQDWEEFKERLEELVNK